MGKRSNKQEASGTSKRQKDADYGGEMDRGNAAEGQGERHRTGTKALNAYTQAVGHYRAAAQLTSDAEEKTGAMLNVGRVLLMLGSDFKVPPASQQTFDEAEEQLRAALPQCDEETILDVKFTLAQVLIAKAELYLDQLALDSAEAQLPARRSFESALELLMEVAEEQLRLAAAESSNASPEMTEAGDDSNTPVDSEEETMTDQCFETLMLLSSTALAICSLSSMAGTQDIAIFSEIASSTLERPVVIEAAGSVGSSKWIEWQLADIDVKVTRLNMLGVPCDFTELMSQIRVLYSLVKDTTLPVGTMIDILSGLSDALAGLSATEHIADIQLQERQSLVSEAIEFLQDVMKVFVKHSLSVAITREVKANAYMTLSALLIQQAFMSSDTPEPSSFAQSVVQAKAACALYESSTPAEDGWQALKTVRETRCALIRALYFESSAWQQEGEVDKPLLKALIDQFVLMPGVNQGDVKRFVDGLDWEHPREASLWSKLVAA